MVISRTVTSVVPRPLTTMPVGDVPLARIVSLTPVPGVADTTAGIPTSRNPDAPTTRLLRNLLIGPTPRSCPGAALYLQSGGLELLGIDEEGVPGRPCSLEAMSLFVRLAPRPLRLCRGVSEAVSLHPQGW